MCMEHRCYTRSLYVGTLGISFQSRKIACLMHESELLPRPTTREPELVTSSDPFHPAVSATQAPDNPGADSARKDSLIVFPSTFPIKIMGINAQDLLPSITAIAQQFDPVFNASTIELRPSSGAKYMGVTITVLATSREQLDALYRALTSHELVKVVL